MVGDAISGAEIALCLPVLAVASLPLCLSWVDGLVSSWLVLLWYSPSPLLCEQAMLCLRLEPFMGKFFFFFSSLAIPQFWLLSHVSSLRLSSGHSGPILTLSMQPTPPCSAPARWWQTRVSGLLLCWEYSVCLFVCLFFLPVMLPSEIGKLPTDPPVRGFPAVWKLLLFHDSLPGTGLHP